MSERRQTATAAALTLLLAVAATARAAGDPGQRCASTKIAAAAKEALCLLARDARTAGGRAQDPGALQRCRDRLVDPARGAFPRAELRGGCAIGGDAAAVDGLVGGLEAELGATLGVGLPNACQAAKIGAAGTEASCLLRLRAREAAGRVVDPAKLGRCGDKLAEAFASADAHGGCATTGDAGTVDTRVQGFADAVVAAEPVLATCATASCPAPVPCDTAAGPCWRPPVQSRWQYQLEGAVTAAGDCAFPATGGIDTTIAAVPFTGGGTVGPAVFDVDFLVDPVCASGGSDDVDNAAAVAAIHAAGGRAICYLDAGTDEPFRPDHQAYLDFDAACGGCLLGKPVAGFAEERWLDVDDQQGQRTFVLARVATRLERCKADGFDAVEFDNVEAYANRTGLPLSQSAQLLFDTALANLAHAHGLTAALKNDLEQIPALLSYFDMAINEQCQEFEECDALAPFVAAGKAVFQVEYRTSPADACPPANAAGRNAVVKTVDLLDVPWTPCR
jgi:hypothetical protein